MLGWYFEDSLCGFHRSALVAIPGFQKFADLLASQSNMISVEMGDAFVHVMMLVVFVHGRVVRDDMFWIATVERTKFAATDFVVGEIRAEEFGQVEVDIESSVIGMKAFKV